MSMKLRIVVQMQKEKKNNLATHLQLFKEKEGLQYIHCVFSK